MNAACGLLQGPRSPLEKKVPVNPAWPGHGSGKFWGLIFLVANGAAQGGQLELCLLSNCSAMLSSLPPLFFRLCSH